MLTNHLNTVQMITQNTINLAKHYESLHDGNLKKVGLQPKLCPAGYWTGGYGRVIIDPATNKPLMGAANKALAERIYGNKTIEQATADLLEDLSRFEAIVRNKLRTNKLTDDQVGALASFAYNVGQGNFSTSTMLKLINQENFAAAAEEFTKWTKATIDGVRKELIGLKVRRMSERHLFLTGSLKFFAK
jgi:lysozyme